MKKVKLEFGFKDASTIADIVGTHGFVLLLSYSKNEGIFDEKIVAHYAVPAEKEDTAVAKLNTWIVKEK